MYCLLLLCFEQFWTDYTIQMHDAFDFKDRSLRQTWRRQIHNWSGDWRVHLYKTYIQRILVCFFCRTWIKSIRNIQFKFSWIHLFSAQLIPFEIDCFSYFWTRMLAIPEKIIDLPARLSNFLIARLDWVGFRLTNENISFHRKAWVWGRLERH